MINKSRNVRMGLLALSTAMAMPMAFAQEQDQTAVDAAATTQAEVQTAETVSTTSATAETSAQAATDTAKPKTWADVDGDKDGNISKTEAAAEPAVGQIFDVADSNKDSKLTPEEYKAYVAKAHGAAKPAGSGG